MIMDFVRWAFGIAVFLSANLGLAAGTPEAANRGFSLYAQGDLAGAEKAFLEAEPKSSRLEEYMRLFQGRIAAQKKDHALALKFYRQALALTETSWLQFEIRFHMAQSLLAQQDFKSARKELEFLARKAQRNQHYPQVLWDLITVEKRFNRSTKVCHHARELYAKYPAHSAVVQWGVILRDNKHNDVKLNCEVSFQDIRTRLKRLQFAGLSQKARSEIDELRKSAGTVTFELDELLAQHLASEGFANDALNLLSKYAKLRSYDRSFLMSFGTMAGRAGEDALSVATYDRLAQMLGASRKGLAAAYQAAFLSYRFQDYDGAERRFQNIVRRLPVKSNQRKEASWYLAWIRYLRGDWAGAAESFKSLLTTYRLPKDSERDFSWNKCVYWYARSLLHMGQQGAAGELFNQLAQDRLRGYYSLAAREWIKQNGIINRPSAPSKSDREIAMISQSASVEGGDTESFEENAEGVTLDSVVEVEGEGAPSDQPLQLSDIQDPKLAARLDRAKDLINLGFKDMARWELADIEKRTRNREYLKTLMSYYLLVDGFNRASAIGSLDFSNFRAKGIENTTRAFWEAAYPKAFEPSVNEVAKRVSIDRYFIWSIIRAESQYRVDVFSPVGAMGLMQVMPNTAEKMATPLALNGFQPLYLLKPETNILIGSSYLDRLYKKFQGQIHLAAAAYNAGPHRVDDWLFSFGDLTGDEFIEHIPFAETRTYVKKVLRNHAIYTELYSRRKPDLSLLADRVPVRVTTRPIGREVWD